jgi:hypothetical protein
MTTWTSPKIEILGLYSFSASSEDYARFIQERIALEDPAAPCDQLEVRWQRLARGNTSDPFTAEGRMCLESEYLELMDEAVLVEVLVSNPDANFTICDFVQPNPSTSHHYWQAAWNPKFLTPDGETLIEVESEFKCPDVAEFRIVFVIHYWIPGARSIPATGRLNSRPSSPFPSGCGAWRRTGRRIKGMKRACLRDGAGFAPGIEAGAGRAGARNGRRKGPPPGYAAPVESGNSRTTPVRQSRLIGEASRA